MSRRTLLSFGISAGVLLTLAGIAAVGYSTVIRQARQKIADGDSRILSSRFGDLEYAVAGSGKPVLMIHGSGGGFDHGIFFARKLVEAGYRVIAPSRFGYLRSDMPADASSENQADAFVDLLDHLGIGSLPMIGGSAGALSAVQLAIRHPDRVNALIAVVPIGYADRRMSAKSMSPLVQAAMKTVLKSDVLFWLALTISPDSITSTALATDPALLHAANKEERQRIAKIQRRILPVSERAQGIMNDTRLSSSTYPVELSAVAAPSLIISTEDDKFGTADAARHLAAGIKGAQLLIYPSGGHLYVGREAELFAGIVAFLKKHDD